MGKDGEDAHVGPWSDGDDEAADDGDAALRGGGHGGATLPLETLLRKFFAQRSTAL